MTSRVPGVTATGACAHRSLLEDLLRQVSVRQGTSSFADGGNQREQGVLTATCPECRQLFAVPIEKLASMVIERQTRDLFGSITELLRGKSQLH